MRAISAQEISFVSGAEGDLLTNSDYTKLFSATGQLLFKTLGEYFIKGSTSPAAFAIAALGVLGQAAGFAYANACFSKDSADWFKNITSPF